VAVTQTDKSHYYFQGEDWDELERKAAKCRANFVLKEFLKSQLIDSIPQRTRNEQKEVTERATTQMTPTGTGQRKRHQQSPSHRPSVPPMARANAENAELWQSLYRASLLCSCLLFCIRTIVPPRLYEKGGKIFSTCLRKYFRVLDRIWPMRPYTFGGEIPHEQELVGIITSMIMPVCSIVWCGVYLNSWLSLMLCVLILFANTVLPTSIGIVIVNKYTPPAWSGIIIQC
jgi:hypothetical protein